ncbi:DUF4367 domain-containing protein [Halobacillus locisalis]|uniref:DUF4367 domain-containing protein n=1 Tax=Halobacillus locisalis TaxID=220753 RepID=A0A838CQT9_9BACI|nr:DUF4367 domain-containing protein [Halobacillus locisalis]MBA2174233.1 DUF4367 domain-containing protein [Halobacillus locisalis]
MFKKILFIVLAFLVTVGCASNQSSGDQTTEENTTDENTVKQDVTMVLEQMFSGPDEELTQYHEEDNYEAISNYYTEKFEPYFTEDYMEAAINTNLLNSFHQKAYGNDVKMEISTMSVEQSEDTETAYDFESQIDVSNGETAGVSGRVNTNEEGNITRIHYIEIESLLNSFDTAVEIEEGLFEYDRSRLVSRTGDEAFQPKYPTIMPFEVNGVEIQPGAMKQKDTVLNFIFHAETEETMKLMTVKDGDISYDDVETEEVLMGDLTGQYAGVEGETQRLIWTDGSITYELKGNVEDLSKEDLTTIAESFE